MSSVIPSGTAPKGTTLTLWIQNEISLEDVWFQVISLLFLNA